jgi:serine/threonine protein phosphatase 1
MSIFAIGDIHGCLTALDTLLTRVPVQPDDTLITLGDYIDRGPDTRAVLDRLIELGSTHHLVALRGNHDQMMLSARSSLRAREDWQANGGDMTLLSYGSLKAVPQAHWDFFERQCVDYWEYETHFFVHGGVYPDLPLWEQPTHKLHWQRFEDVQPHESGKIMVCGHTSQKNGLPNDIGYAVCIDTWVYSEGGWLSCLDIGTGRVWQANQEGESRQFRLTDLTGNSLTKG